jgi:hypothetical protein
MEAMAYSMFKLGEYCEEEARDIATNSRMSA